jgi:hypothetical protein
VTGVRPAQFTVQADWANYDVPALSGSTNALVVGPVSAFIDFIPRLPAGFEAFVDNYDVHGDGSVARDTGVTITPLTARITNGQLATINVADSVGVSLIASDPILGLAGRADAQPYLISGALVYDVRFRKVQYGGDNTEEISNFAFAAPTTATTITLTDPTLTRYPYKPARDWVSPYQ